MYPSRTLGWYDEIYGDNEVYGWLEGPLIRTRKFEAFQFLIEIIPVPYSIRNAPDTNLWLRLRDPSYPLNPDTLIFKVNGVDITANCVVNRVINGVEIFYDPPVDFTYGSRVYVDLSIGTSNVYSTTFDEAAPIGDQYLLITGDAERLNPGGELRLGPNAASETETVTLLDITEADELYVPAITYEYSEGDDITYFRIDDTTLILKYYFDIIPDYRPPWFENLYPAPYAESVSVDTYISFDVKDLGLGVNINSLVFRINDMNVSPDITKYNDNYYHVSFKPDKKLFYNAWVYCYARVEDLAAAKNSALEFWRFKTQNPELPLLMDFDPECCDNPVYSMTDIQFDIYGRTEGLDLDSLVVTIDGINYTMDFWPKIYRY